MSKPNVILFNWHDAGDWFGCYGYNTVNTPHVDRLAREGVRFVNNFSACAICSPSRAAIATGKYCQNNGVMTLTNSPFHNRIHPDVPHIARRFKDLGYKSALFGIQHEAAHEHVETIMGFDEQFATDPWPNADILSHYASDWLDNRSDDDQPFFMQVGTIDAHLNRFYSGAPATENEPYAPVQDTSKGIHMPACLTGSEADKETVATLQGLLQRGDRLVGAILDALDKNGLSENTLFIMNVDHGVGLHRAKTNCYDAGTKTAWNMRWVNTIKPGTEVQSLSTHVDVLPTVWSLLNNTPIEGLDGCDFSQHILQSKRAELHDYVYSHMVENTRSIRNTEWKLIRNFRPNAHANNKGDCGIQHKLHDTKRDKCPTDITPCTDYPDLELYDLKNDPHELNNLAYDKNHSNTKERLNADLWAFLIKHNDFLIHDTVNSPWQAATRKSLETHCAANDIRLLQAEGPLGNPIDQASANGQIFKNP